MKSKHISRVYTLLMIIFYLLITSFIFLLLLEFLFEPNFSNK